MNRRSRRAKQRKLVSERSGFIEAVRTGKWKPPAPQAVLTRQVRRQEQTKREALTKRVWEHHQKGRAR